MLKKDYRGCFMNTDPNLYNRVRLRAVANLLSRLNVPVVFVGGTTISLYVDEAAAGETRPTDDVDVALEVTSYMEFTKIEERLREIGLVNDAESSVLIRYKAPGYIINLIEGQPTDIIAGIQQGITVDFMPIKEIGLGPVNIWYPEGFINSVPIDIGSGTEIKVFPFCYFIASKIEAFKGRGQNDYYGSKDFEDIIFVLDNTGTDLLKKLKGGSEAVQAYLKAELKTMLEDPRWREAAEAHIGRFGMERANILTQILREYIDSN